MMTCGYCERKGHSKRTCALKKSNEALFEVARFPQKLNAGNLARVVLAPPRYEDEHPRQWSGITGTIVLILAGPVPDCHNWGGEYNCFVQQNGGYMARICGDFLEVVR
jgi:hypothetical protein